MKKILFVCTGNTCRSPMAEELAKAEIQKRNLPLSAESAGLAAFPGSPASSNAIAAVKEAGGNLQDFHSRQLTPELVRSADKIYCMTQNHLTAARNCFPEETKKFVLLGKKDIQDPYGGDLETYRKTMAQIQTAVKDIFNQTEEGQPQ